MNKRDRKRNNPKTNTQRIALRGAQVIVNAFDQDGALLAQIDGKTGQSFLLPGARQEDVTMALLLEIKKLSALLSKHADQKLKVIENSDVAK